MNQEIKQQWVTALRSGEYEQGQNVLRADDKFCCLGVLCDLAVKANVTTGTFDEETGKYCYGGEYRESIILPSDVINWAGLSGSNPEVPVEGGDYQEAPVPDDSDYLPGNAALAELNDGLCGFRVHDFNQIADLIEQHL